MNDDALVARLTDVLAESASCRAAYGVVTADVPRQGWVEAVRAVRDDEALDAGYFDLLTAVDVLDAGLEVVVRLWSLQHRHAVHLRTRCPRDDARVPSLTPLFGGAAWHERAAAELFGIGFDGHPALQPLLLAPGSALAPLRKENLLESRQAVTWPGVVEPGREPGERGGRVRLPPGVAEGRGPA